MVAAATTATLLIEILEERWQKGIGQIDRFVMI
jgi:hypothetical protein